MEINKLCQDAHSISREKGWYSEGERNVGELIALIHSELSEALEEFRNGHKATEVYYPKPPEQDILDELLADKIITQAEFDKMGGEPKLPKPEGVPIEIADAVIRIADLCGYLGIDLEEAIRIKTEYNKTRATRHGGKKF